MKQLLLLALVITLGVAIIKFYTGHTGESRQTSYKTITAQEAKDRLDSGDTLILVDVRTHEEFNQGHIPGALCLPNEEIDAASAAENLPDQASEILVYCRSGRRSAEAAKKLAALGYTQISDFGGINDWPYETTTE